MTALAGNTFLNMPYMESLDSLNCALNQNTFDNVDSTDSFLKSEIFPQKQQVSTCAVSSTNNNQQQNGAAFVFNEQTNNKRAAVSTSTNNKINNSSPSNASSAIDSGISSIKSEEYNAYGSILDVDSAVSSGGSSPTHILLGEFDNTLPQLTYYSQLCEEDSTSEASFASATSPTMPPNDFPSYSFSDNLQPYTTSYYDIINQPPPFEPNPTVPQSMDQMRFIIYEPTNDGAPLVPTLNQSTIWPAMVPPDALTRNTFQPQSGLSFPYEFAANSVTSPIDPASSSSSPQLAPQQTQTGAGANGQQQQPTQQQQQMIKCPHEDCPKTFSRLYNLKAHLRSHSPARPYQCPMCPRSFSRKHDLQRHIRVHTGVKPYQCPCCHKAFARTDALRRHFKMEETCRSSPEVQNMKTRRRYSDLH
ncbi:8526_t:CDS:1 [Paraglomus brasilianum]|uniref:8526_t:CDS:1 n=1 Tax=Paraglomus brasilianum TaxID=144538 RepID=A0A9N9F897_9GLOM|nr:8526_t:CDS:1 [Paraglomus brasilianum]